MLLSVGTVKHTRAAQKAALLLGFLLLFVGSTDAVDCGDVLSGNGSTFTLDDDLECDCDSDGFAVKITGTGITLDLNGFDISCDDDSSSTTTLRVEGTRNTVTNGSVSGGFIVVSLAGNGRHKLTGSMTIGNNADDAEADGIVVTSNANKIGDATGTLTITDCGGDGIDIDTGYSRNTITNFVIEDFGDDGISCRGNRNHVKNGEISDPKSGSEDCVVLWGNCNTIENVSVDGCQRDGFRVQNDGSTIATNNVLRNCQSDNCDGDGYDVRGRKTQFCGCDASGNGGASSDIKSEASGTCEDDDCDETNTCAVNACY